MIELQKKYLRLYHISIIKFINKLKLKKNENIVVSLNLNV